MRQTSDPAEEEDKWMTRMPEAEVSLRLAFWLFARDLVDGAVEVAIDGAQVRTGTVLHFDLPGFMVECGWSKEGGTPGWQCGYRAKSHGRLQIHSTPGKGDVVARLRSGHTLRVECKKGPLLPSKSSQEYPLIREALGQLLTVQEVRPDDILAVAVPHSPKFVDLAARWREAPLIKRFGIQILTVDRGGEVSGLVQLATAGR